MYRADGRAQKQRRRFNDAGHAHELTFCCYHGIPLLSKDRTREWFVESLDRARKQHDFELWAYVIMPEHVHLLIYPRTDVYQMDLIVKSIKQPVARKATNYLREHHPEWLERLRVERGGRTEHRFWQDGGGYDRNMVNEDAVWASVNYLHENHVRRGLVETATDWVWSSARCYAGMEGVKLEMDDGIVR